MEEFRKTYGHSYGLIIGINTYADARFMPLGQAEEDANAFAELLAGQPYCFEVKTLIGNQATKTAILQELNRLRATEVDDRVLVYFAGHGYTLNDRFGNETGFLAAADTVPDQDFTALKLEEVIDLTRFAAAKHISFVFDACFSGQALGLTRAPSVAADKFMERRAYQVLSAGAGDQTVSDFHSMTEHMLEALRGDTLLDDGIATLSKLGLFLQQKIASDSGQTQIPQFGHIRGSQGGDLVFYVDHRVRLPGDLEDALKSPRANARLGAAVDLIDLARGGEPEIAQLAVERLVLLRDQDADQRVRAAAQSYFDEVEAEQRAADALREAQRVADESRERTKLARQSRLIAVPPRSKPSSDEDSVEGTAAIEASEVKAALPPDIPAARRIPMPVLIGGGALVLILIIGGIVLPMQGNFGQPAPYDNFNNAAYDGDYNHMLWLSSDGCMSQNEGVLRANNDGSADALGCVLTVFETDQPAANIGTVSARMRAEQGPTSPGQANQAVRITATDSSGIYWLADCGFEASTDGLKGFLNYGDPENANMIYKFQPLEVGRWYDVDLAIDPDTLDISCYIGDILIGSGRADAAKTGQLVTMYLAIWGTPDAFADLTMDDFRFGKGN